MAAPNHSGYSKPRQRVRQGELEPALERADITLARTAILIVETPYPNIPSAWMLLGIPEVPCGDGLPVA
jgi:hypothetical protein